MAKKTNRAEHPLSTVITHWIHIVALFTLIFTGLWIHDPFTDWKFHTVRYVHLFAAFFLVGTGIFRVYWGFFGRGSTDVGGGRRIRDWHFFFPQKENRGTFWPMVAYYLFLRKTHPCTAKYNPLQKLAYGALLFAIILDAFTGWRCGTSRSPTSSPSPTSWAAPRRSARCTTWPCGCSS